MLKKIAAKELRVGMHLEELCGSWMEHPFWRTRFLIEDQRDIERIRDSGIDEVWIDTSKGLDVAAPGQGEVTREAVEAETEARLARAAASERLIERVPLADELTRAAATCRKAKRAVVSMFQEARMGRAIDAQSALTVVDEITDSIERNPGALISLARLKNRDEYTYMHSVAVCALMVALARQLKLPEAETRQAGLAGLVHDLGKAMVPLDILNKPGKLTDEEFVAIKKHPELGHAMLLEGGSAGPIPLDVCLHHHEKVDGSGYPARLSGDAISLFAKMGAVCDVYDAITSDRPYKSGWNPAESIRKMAEWSHGHFDDAVFQAFVKAVGIYPVGSLVKMESGRLAVVIEQNESKLLAPRVKVFFSTRSQLRIPPEVIDLSLGSTRDCIVGREDPDKWKFPDLNALWAGATARS
jgi:HD-GYP domain-containing protein (c-di-GMP phosphodiesterase class II)